MMPTALGVGVSGGGVDIFFVFFFGVIGAGASSFVLALRLLVDVLLCDGARGGGIAAAAAAAAASFEAALAALRRADRLDVVILA